TEKCGYGIAADEDIKSGEFIIEFVEEVIDEKTCEETLLKMKHRVEANFYLCQINWNMVIDATYKGNKSRYFNHSCNPSTEMQKWIIDGETRVGIFAIRYITKGEHLTYDYQFVQLGADQDCYCGAVGCRKMLGANASKAKNIPSDEAVNLTACKGVSDLESPQASQFRGKGKQFGCVRTISEQLWRKENMLPQLHWCGFHVGTTVCICPGHVRVRCYRGY
ncbi:unnamed protein product, partial [Brassica oleracea var. botrytis]